MEQVSGDDLEKRCPKCVTSPLSRFRRPLPLGLFPPTSYCLPTIASQTLSFLERNFPRDAAEVSLPLFHPTPLITTQKKRQQLQKDRGRGDPDFPPFSPPPPPQKATSSQGHKWRFSLLSMSLPPSLPPLSPPLQILVPPHTRGHHTSSSPGGT